MDAVPDVMFRIQCGQIMFSTARFNSKFILSRLYIVKVAWPVGRYGRGQRGSRVSLQFEGITESNWPGEQSSLTSDSYGR